LVAVSAEDCEIVPKQACPEVTTKQSACPIGAGIGPAAFVFVLASALASPPTMTIANAR
jgi:hypothetical protein